MSITSVEGDTPSNRGYLKRLWRGEIGLGTTYWVFGFVIGLILRLISPLITYLLVSNATLLSNFDTKVISYSWSVLLIAYSVFIFVAIWRSANRYKVEKPTRKSRGTLAQGAVVLGALTLLGGVGKLITADELSPPSALNHTADEKAQLQATIAGLNAGLPKKVDDQTTLTRIDVVNQKWTYLYALSLPIVDMNKFQTNMRSIILRQCTSADFVKMIRGAGPIVYQYTDSNGVVVPISIAKTDCGT